jgi:hypothetical protein
MWLYKRNTNYFANVSFMVTHHSWPNMDRAPKSQSIDVQNPITTQTWCEGKMCNMVGHIWWGWKHIHLPHEKVPKFSKGECGHGKLAMEWNIYKRVPHKEMSRCQESKTILAIHGMFFFFHSRAIVISFLSYLLWFLVSHWPHLCRYACGYGPEDNYGDNTHY